MLAHSGTSACRDDSRECRDVDRPTAVSPGAAGVDAIVRNGDRHGVVPHRRHEADELVDRLALGAKGSGKCRDLCRQRLTRQDLGESVGRESNTQVASTKQLAENRRPTAGLSETRTQVTGQALLRR